MNRIRGHLQVIPGEEYGEKLENAAKLVFDPKKHKKYNSQNYMQEGEEDKSKPREVYKFSILVFRMKVTCRERRNLLVANFRIWHTMIS